MNATSFDKNWSFSCSTGTAALVVDLPHDFMISTERTADARTEGAGGFFQGGIGTYEKHFTISEDKKTDNLFCSLRVLMEIRRSGSMAICLHCTTMAIQNFM